jgi:hypothetical protein
MAPVPLTLRLVLVPESGAEVAPPESWLAAARAGLATSDELAALAARLSTVEAGTNVRVTVEPDTQVLRISAVGGVASYRAVGETGELTADDNGRVVEVDSAEPVTLTVPTGLPRGWCCVVRQVGAGAVTVRAAPGLTLVPEARDLATAALWQEVTLEARGADQVIGREVP